MPGGDPDRRRLPARAGDGRRALGRAGRRRARAGRRSAPTTGAVRVSDSPSSPTPSSFSRPAGGRRPRHARHRHRARLGCRTRAVRRPRPRSRRRVRRPVRPARWRPSASCSTTGWRPTTRSTCGAPAPTPATCSARACGRWSTIPVSPSPRWRSTWSPNSTATPPTPTPSSTSRGTPTRRWRCWPRSASAIDRPTATAAAGQRHSGARGRPQRARGAGPPGPLAAVRSTPASSAGRRRSADSAGGPARRRAGCADRFELLADYGIPVARSRAAHDLAEALAAAERDRLPGRAENPWRRAQERRRWGGARHRRRRRTAGGLRCDGARRWVPTVSVDAMAAPGVEISVGCRARRRFGPLVVVAAGGTLVELLADRAVACPPVTRRTRDRHACGRCASAPLLAGWRGAPPVDIEALADVDRRILRDWQPNSASSSTRSRPTR